MSYQRKQEDKRRNEKLFKDSRDAGYPCPIWPSRDDTHYKRYWKSDGKSSVWAVFKKQSHKAARRKYKKNLDDKTSYNKMFDLWWNVY